MTSKYERIEHTDALLFCQNRNDSKVKGFLSVISWVKAL